MWIYALAGLVPGLALGWWICQWTGKVGHLHRELERLQHLVRRDPLTGVYNRVALDEVLTQQVSLFRRYGFPCAVILLDLDHFKSINDRHGHLMGDDVLRQVCQRWQTRIRSSDVLARYGGDEFALVLPHTPLTGAKQLADRLRRDCEQLSWPTPNAGTLSVTCSAGVAEVVAREDDHEAVLARADAQLLEAKRAGKNRAV